MFPDPSSRPGGRTHHARGISLIELVVTMTILAAISVVTAIALRDPIRAYADTNRRAELTDLADTAVRRIARDVRLALPNSVRVTGAGPVYLELMLTRTGGRYRAQGDASATGNVLDLTAADTAFDTLGPLSSATGQAIVAGDILVVHNLFAGASVTSGNAWTYNQAAWNCTSATSYAATCNTARITGTAAGTLANETRVSFESRRFPLGSPGNRFHVVSGPVTYACAAGPVDARGDGTGTLTRVSDYTIALTQPAGSYPGGGTSGLLAGNVTACDISYDAAVAQGRGLVTLRIAITRGNETVNLHHAVHVFNIP